MTVNALLFDMDGTLVDTLRDIAQAGNSVLAQRGYPTWPVDDYRHFVGDGTRVLCERIAPRDLEGPDLDDLHRAYVAEYQAHALDHSALYPGVRELLDALRLRNTPRGIITNKPQAFATDMAAALLEPDDFAFVWGERPGVPRKPDPTSALAASVRLGLRPADLAFVGDSAIDMRTAHGAGMLAVGVAWGFRGVDELRAHGAAAIIERPSELLGMLA